MEQCRPAAVAAPLPWPTAGFPPTVLNWNLVGGMVGAEFQAVVGFAGAYIAPSVDQAHVQLGAILGQFPDHLKGCVISRLTAPVSGDCHDYPCLRYCWMMRMKIFSCLVSAAVVFMNVCGHSAFLCLLQIFLVIWFCDCRGVCRCIVSLLNRMES